METEKDNKGLSARRKSPIKSFRALSDLDYLIESEDTTQAFLFKNSPNTRSAHGKEIEDLISLMIRQLDSMNPASAKEFDKKVQDGLFSEFEGISFCASTKKYGTVLCFLTEHGTFFKSVKCDWNSVKDLDVDVRYSLTTTQYPPSILGVLGEPEHPTSVPKSTTYVAGTSTDPVLLHILHRNSTVHDVQEEDLKVRCRGGKQTSDRTQNRHQGSYRQHVSSRTERWHISFEDEDEDGLTIFRTFGIKRFLVNTNWNARSKVLKSNVTNAMTDFCVSTFNPRALGFNPMGEFRDTLGKRTGYYMLSTETAIRCIVKLSLLKYTREDSQSTVKEGRLAKNKTDSSRSIEEFYRDADLLALEHLDTALLKHQSSNQMDFEIRRIIHPVDFRVDRKNKEHD